MDNLLQKMNINLNDIQSNSLIYGLLAVFLALYGPRLHPKLPSPIRDLFNNNYFRFTVILLITYLSTKNLQAALIISISFCLIMSYANSQQVEIDAEEHFKENYSNFDTIREFYNNEEDFGNPARDKADKVYGDDEDSFKNPNETLSSASDNFTNLFQKVEKFKKQKKESFDNHKDDSEEEEGEEEGKGEEEGEEENEESYTNYEHFNDNEMPQECQNKNSKECLELCYSSAGSQNSWCEKVHPNPQNVLMLSKKCKKKEGFDINKQQENKKTEDFISLPSISQLDNLTKNIVEQVKKYKKILV